MNRLENVEKGQIPKVRLGDAKFECPQCKGVMGIDQSMRYLYEIVLQLQKGEKVIIYASEYKLSLYEGILGLLARFKVKEISRKVVKVEDKNGIKKDMLEIMIQV